MDGAADILHRGVADHAHDAEVDIDLDVADVGAEAALGAFGVELHAGADRPAHDGALAARSASVSGGNSPAFGLAGCAAPFSHFTASGSMSQILAARSRSVVMIFSADCVTTIAEANNTRLPPVRFEKPTVAVSPIRTETRR